MLGADGVVERIVEHKDANEAERANRLCNSGVMCADAKTLFELLAQVKNENVKGEYYLTDVVGLGRAAGQKTQVLIGEESDALGVNSKVELAAAEAGFQRRARIAAMEAGVTLIDPDTVFFSYDTEVAADVLVEPNVFFGKGVKIGKGARIHAFCHFEQTEIGENAEIGPFARFRPGSKLGRKTKIGNFVEVKNSTFGEGAKASHLSYIGDADVGARANIGAGTIVCNYDGFDKYRTTIGDDAFIGSDTALVAPVRVGDRAYTGTGSVITKDVPDGALGVARGRQSNLDGWADKNRAKKLAAKAVKKDKA
jgi:bifunctional UDP-N-acetylglucosamine pyrophosphorylase/glucosamine-1-phosphate N-acetyltransferase